ncbi:LPS-assembly protein [Mesorhizobium sp. J18]|uniref:LPS-assembly protein LptD n=1 Tax=Mesorhizobium sp. J18 TaxID=935263 RepID=UPI0011999AC5|nr:LPS-assembly protein LptD [Mesorhizobium sp. J18]TWG93751.1 LPS-assembly protein [Mesorhizobium sp. J18]
MGNAVTGSRKTIRVTRLLGASALVCVFCFAVASVPTVAQTINLEERDVPQDAQMLLESDTLVYDNDRNTIMAVGGVQIEYGGNRLVAQRVTYDRNTSRLIASGNVEIVEKDGNRIYADEIDVTDDFRDGFVNTLRVESVDKTYFAAESAKREGGTVTTFNNGVYTACEPCEEKPDRPPIWRVKARKIIWNGQTKTVRFEKANFEFFGMPLAYLPFFEIADPTVKRKSGFLFPSFEQSSETGFGVRVPYYFALSPTYDLTVAVTGFIKQGFLGEAEWRQQFDNGSYSLKIAGISQRDPEAFDRNRVNSSVTDRGMIGTKGEFKINPRWAFGWDILAQTDQNFSYTYGIEGYSDLVHRSEIYLTGLNDRNYFDLRAMHFDVQEDILQSSANSRDDKQPWVLPNFDYAYTPDEPVAGGELNIDVNAQLLDRDEMQSTLFAFDLDGEGGDSAIDLAERIPGPEGTTGRLTAEAEWRRSLVTDGGLVITPLLQARGDTIFTGYSNDTVNEFGRFAPGGPPNVAHDIRSAYYRYMATAGLEARWPVLFSTSSSTHVLEPMAQIFVRPDTPYQDVIGIPNEDAQSLVFDATSLFERDKFSGYDRIEGGTRANLGIRYSGVLSNGWTLNGLFGQSYHLAGDNPFASPDLVNVGAYSGLETDVSDFVGMVGIGTPHGFSASLGGRFDEETFDLRRTDIRAAYTSKPLSLSLQYAFIEEQPLYGPEGDRQEVTGTGRIRFFENWSAFGSATYDVESQTVIANSIGFAYDDECFIYAMGFQQTRNPITGEVREKFGLNISLRTLGQFGTQVAQAPQFAGTQSLFGD